MTAEPRFLTEPEVLVIHRMQLRVHGGADGLRDAAMLDSALNRPVNQWHYVQASITELAAAYAFGIARNHPFVDGNKRTALVAAYTFLGLNGYELVATEAEAVVAILALAAGELTEEQLALWFADHSGPLTP